MIELNEGRRFVHPVDNHICIIDNDFFFVFLKKDG